MCKKKSKMLVFSSIFIFLHTVKKKKKKNYDISEPY